MVWCKFSVAVILCSVLMVQSRIRFKMTKTCEHKRDVTFILLSSIYYSRHEIRPIIQRLLKYKDEACLNLSMVVPNKLEPENVNTLKSFDKLFILLKEEWPNILCRNLKDYLQLFLSDKIHKSPQTLVVFGDTSTHDHCDILDILYELQTGKNVAVILLSEFFGVFHLKQDFSRLLKFSRRDVDHETKLINVIKNPNFDRFQFQKNLPEFKDRSCLQNAKLILVYSFVESQLLQLFVDYGVEEMKHYNKEALDVHLLSDVELKYSLNRHNNLYYISNYGNMSYTDLMETGLLEGPKQKIFLFLSSASSPDSPDSGLMKMEELLKDNNQTDIAKVFFDHYKWNPSQVGISWDLSYGGSVTREYDIQNRNGIDIMMDILLDLCK